MATYSGSQSEVGLDALIESSPASRVRMSMAAETALVCGLGAVLTATFSILFSLAVALSALALVAGLVGLITTRTPEIAGSALNVLGLLLALLALALIGVRFLGIDTTVGDPLLPGIADQLHHWNAKLPQPS
ncbi:hypothetical protein OG394_02740 [Kribbella sp. NBC_01245]|uniref:hypothetical protein n=1 Tax=Kribbella sp. NBC_01245 TaxID=2903578 RepID=UPI002E2D6A1A|nr:hypothetical protein [Kribbella sp. NBC_01245]